MTSKVSIVCVLLILIPLIANAAIDSQCLACICQIESGCSALPCKWDVNSISCGYYQLKQGYWEDCGSPGGSLKACAADKSCSESCVRAYMNRYASRCTSGRTPTCQDYARIHNGGPNGCKSSGTVGYWNRVSSCYSG